MKRIAILGSTGSIGVSALDVIRQHPDKYTVVGLAAGCRIKELQAQATEFGVEITGASTEAPGITFCGEDAAIRVIEESRPDMVINGIAGAAGFLPSLKAAQLGIDLALANKESLVIGGSFLTKTDIEILPVDSEHSAIFQCLQGEDLKAVRRLILTASGGPFRNTPIEEFAQITPAQALKHPTWEMGRRITIDSATMMNKGLEIIEAAWLFGLPMDRIETIIHPSSIVHSMVEFDDMSIKAQLGYPDMRVPIAYALSWPTRFKLDHKPLNISEAFSLDFFPPEHAKFPALELAKEAYKKPATLPCVMNAADEVAIDAFLNERITFDRIIPLVADTMDRLHARSVSTPDDLIDLDLEARRVTEELIK